MATPRQLLLLSTALSAALAMPAQAQTAAMAQPQGGRVVAGAAVISQSANLTAITQSSQNAAINWQSFNVGSAQTVAIEQPNAQSMTLNRVVGPDPSIIAGHITANGGVAIVNQSGVVFTPGSQVDVNTLVVSSANISNKNLMAGKLAFTRPGKPNAAIVNAGTITIKQAGLTALVAPSVRNTGLIQAKLGNVVLAGAQAATLDLYGDGLVSIDVTKQVTRAPIGPGGKPVEALVTNTGTIRADGGTVQLTASAADGVVQNLVSAGGTISVNGGRGTGGSIVLAGVGGSMVIEGALSATGSTGGTVQAETDGAVTVAKSARIDASGRNGGGTVTLGGGKAATVTLAQGAVVKANATRRGNGGHVAVVATNSAAMNGAISARGGPLGGNGGTVEVSAPSLGVTGPIDTAAPAGLAGTILLDPDFLNIVHGTAGTGSQDPTFVANNGTVPNTAPSIGGDTLTDQETNSLTGNVLLEANQSITVANGVRVNLGASGQSLVLEAGGTITVAAGATLRASGNVELETGDAIAFTPPAATANPLVEIDGTVASTHGNLFINAGTGGTIAMGAAGLLNASGSTNAVMSLVGDTLALTPGAQLRGVTLDLAPATMGSTITLGGTWLASLDGVEVTTLVLGGALAPGGSAPVIRAGDITVVGSFDATSVVGLELLGSGTISQTAEIVNVGVLSGQAAAILLTNPANTISDLGSLTASTGALDVTTTVTLVVTGPVTASSGAVTLSAPSLALEGAVSADIQAGLQTNTLSVAGGSLAAPLVELAPLTAGTTVSLGGAGGLSLVSTAGISATTLRLGGLTAPGASGPTITAGAIAIPGTFDAAGIGTLDLLTTGAITQSAALIIPGTLAGSAGSLALTNSANNIAIIGSLTTTGMLVLTDAAPSLTLAGPVAAAGGAATLSDTGTLIIAGSLAAAGVSLAADTIDLPGRIDAGAGILVLTASGDIAATGTLSAGTLTGSAGGSAEFTGTNAIGTLGNFTAGADFVLDDGAVAAGNSTLAVSGVIAAGTAAGPGATPNTLEIDATGLLSITGSLTSGLAGAGYRGGGVVLSAASQPGGTPGEVSVLGSVAAVANGTGGTDSVAITAPVITIGGTLSATSDLAHHVAGLVTLRADTLTIGGAVSVPGGMAAIAPLNLDALAVATAPVGGALTLAPADLARIELAGGGAGAGSGELVLGSPNGATASVGTLSLLSALTLPDIATIGLFSLGTITQDPAAPLTVASLVGAAGQISLPAANAIAAIGVAGTPFAPAGTPADAGLTASGGIDLTDTGPLSVAGPTGLVAGLGAASSASLTLTEDGTLLVDGPLGNCGTGALGVGADAITIGLATAPTLWSIGALSLTPTGALAMQAGVVDGAGIVLGGTISQSGGLIASSGSVSINGPFIQSAGTLAAGGALTVGSGTGSAGSASGSATGGSFTQSGGIVLAGGDITIWSTGTVSQSNGTLAAGGTLALSAAGLAQGMGAGGSALLSGADAVRLYAAAGDVRQGGWGTLAAGASGIAVQAPAGTVTVWSIAPAAGGAAAVNVALLGNAIDLFADAPAGSPGPLVLNAGTLVLISRLDTTEAPGGAIDAELVTGSAGLANPVLPPDLQTPTWAPAAGSAVQLGSLTGGGSAAQSVTNANSIATLGSYGATGGLSLTDATALTVAGPVQASGDVLLAAAGALSVPGSIAGADVTLLADENLLNTAPSTAAPAGLSIAGSVLAPTGTIDLDAEAGIVETGTLAAATLTGRAGRLAADTALPPNERIDETGAISLTGTTSGRVSSNTLANLGMLLATGGIALDASPAAATLTLAGPITAGYGGLAADTTLSVGLGDSAGGPGTLAVAGPLAVASAGGGVVLTASGDVTVSGVTTAGTSDTLIDAPDSIAVLAGGAYIQSGGLVAAGGVSLSAPGGVTLDSGIVLSTSAAGIAAPDGPSTIAGGLMVANGNGGVQLAALTQTGGTLSANGSVFVAGGLAQSGGTLAAAGDVALGALGQSAGTVSAGGSVTIGAGTGIAGDSGSQATSGSFNQTGGTVVASGDIAVWTTGTASQSAGTLAAGARVGLTAQGALDQSNAGLISAAGTLALLANGGDAAQDAAALLAGSTVTVQAPSGDVSFVNIALAGMVGAAAPATPAIITCPSCAVPLIAAPAAIAVTPVAALAAPAAAAQTASDRVNVTLAGDTVSIPRDLTAGQLTLTSTGATRQSAGTVIAADSLTGSAGSASLGTLPDPTAAVETASNANAIAVLGDYTTTGSFSLTDATSLAVSGTVRAGTNLRIGTAAALSIPGTAASADVLLLANENLFNAGSATTAVPADLTITGAVTAAGTLALWAERSLDAPGTLSAALLTGRVGVLAGDTSLPVNFRADIVGGADLTGANAVAALGTFLATGGIALADTPPSGTLALTGPLTAGEGSLAAADLALNVTGGLAVAGAISAPSGSASLNASGDITLAETTVDADVATTISTDGTFTQTSGSVAGGTVTLAAAGGKTVNEGLIVSTGTGIDFTDTVTVVDDGIISATGTGSITGAALIQNGGVISANGSASLASLTQTAGTLTTVGNIAIAGALSQSGGTVSTGGTLTLGAGTGTAGLGGSAATAGALQQTGGSLLASRDMALWSASPAVSQQSGLIAAGGRVGLTAAAGIAQQDGTISAAGGVALLANTGDLTQDAAAVLAGPAATGSGPGVMVQAPQGNTDAVTVLLAGAVGAATPASLGSVTPVSFTPPTAQGAARVNVLLLGDTIAIDKNLTAGTLALYSLGDTQLDAGEVIDARVLQGSAGWAAGWTVPGTTGWSAAPLGWTAGVGSAALGGAGVPLSAADETLSSLNRIPTLAGYATTGDFSLADAGALAIAGPVSVVGNATLAAGGTITLAGSLAAGNALLIANHALATLSAPADLLLASSLAVPGTLELWAEQNLTATGPITAGTLAARAGELAADTSLPANFRNDRVGGVALTGANAIATIGPVLATGDITIDTATTTLAGPVVAGYGGLLAAPVLDLAVAGDLAATGQAASCGGSSTIAATGAITLTDALIFAPTALGITAGTAYAQTGGAVVSDSLTITAPTRLLDNGTILSPGTGAAPAIDLAGGTTTITNAGIVSAGGANALVSFGTLSLTSGTVASAGVLQADAVVQQAGTIAAAGNTSFGSLQQQAGGLIAVGGDLTIGTGTGTAGQLASQAATGAVGVAGTIEAAGTLTLWSAGDIGLSGTVLAGRALATAAGTIEQSAGLLVGDTGVALLATGGDASQAPGATLAGGATYDVEVRAPLGTVSFGNITLPGGTLPAPPSVSLAAPALICTACMMPLPLTASVPLPLAGTVLPASSVTVPAPVLTARAAGSGIPDVTLAGAALTQDASQVLTASTLSLFATDSADEQGTLIADVLTGAAGLAQPVQGLAATDPAAWVHLDGAANSIAILGDFTATGMLRLTDAGPLTIPDSTISAPLIRLLTTSAIDFQDGVFITGGETGLPARGGLATDPTDATYTDDSQQGLYLSFTGAVGQVIQTGLTQLEPIGALPALLRIDLPMASTNSVNFDTGIGLDYGLFGRTAVVFLHLGDGWARGNINVGQLSVIYSSVPAVKTRMTGTLLNSAGLVIDAQIAATLASIGTSDGQFLPSGVFQLNGCALTTTSCVMTGQRDSVPVQSQLRPIDFGSDLDPLQDPDLLMPNVSDRDY